MYKKILMILIIIVGFISFKFDVFAINTSAKQGETNFDAFKSEFDKGIVQKNISSPSTEVVLYGKSECVSGGNCTYQYQGVNVGDSHEVVLGKMIRCANGETSIDAQDGGSGGVAYKGSNSENYNGTVYWTETYYVTCISNQNNNSIGVNDNTSNNSTNNNDTTTDTNTSNNTSNQTDDDIQDSTDDTDDNEDSNYNSSSTEESPKTGVTTYYIILILVALVTYLIMLVIKKFNLFQKI